MNRYERQWFTWMLRRPVQKRLIVAIFLPYWMIRTPIFVLAFILRHADKKHTDRLKS